MTRSFNGGRTQGNAFFFACPRLPLNDLITSPVMSMLLIQAKGNAAFAGGKFEEAIEHFSRGIEVDAGNHVLYSNRSAAQV